MKVQVTYRKHNPTTSSGHCLEITRLYFGTDAEIAEMENWCKDKISTGLVLDFGDKALSGDDLDKSLGIPDSLN